MSDLRSNVTSPRKFSLRNKSIPSDSPSLPLAIGLFFALGRTLRAKGYLQRQQVSKVPARSSKTGAKSPPPWRRVAPVARARLL